MDSLAFDSTTTPNILLSVLTVKKPRPKLLLRPITVGAIRAMNQSEFLTISRILFKVREKSRVQGVIDFGLASHWLKNWREIFPFTERSTSNRVIAFDSRLKTA